LRAVLYRGRIIESCADVKDSIVDLVISVAESWAAVTCWRYRTSVTPLTCRWIPAQVPALPFVHPPRRPAAGDGRLITRAAMLT
jgi:hypothetical protein